MSSGSRRGRSSTQGTVWEVVEIVAENGKLYQVRWAGKDPETGKPWPLDWIPSSHCSPELIKNWERTKAKKQVSLDSAPNSRSPSAPVARKRPSEKRNTTSTTEPPVRSTRKRRHPTPSGSPDNTGEDSAPPRKKKLTATVEGETGSKRDSRSTAHAPSRPSRGNHSNTKILPPHPPLEEIDVWVPTPNAKFGPPKRKRAASERQISPQNGPKHVGPPAVASTQASGSTSSSFKLPILTESQIIALREEEEEDSQIQFPDLQLTSTPPGLASISSPSDPLLPSADGVRVAAEVSRGNSHGSLERSMHQASGDVQPTNPEAGNAPVSEPNNQTIHVQPNATNDSLQDEGATRIDKGISPLPTATHISLINPNPSSSVSSSSKSLQKPARPSPLPTGKPGATSIEQPSSKSESSRSGVGTLAERRAFEARVRLDELRRAATNTGSIAKGHTSAPKMSQNADRAPAHVVLKQVMDDMGASSQSQITAPRNSGNEIQRDTSQSERHRPDPPDKLEEAMIIRKKTDDANVESLRQQDHAVAENTQVPQWHFFQQSSEDEVPPTASSSDGSQSHNPSPQASLGSQLAAALSLLHKKSEEISELRAQVNTLRRRTTDGDANIVYTQAGKSQNSWEGRVYQAVEVQTDRELEADTALDPERALWNQEKAALQDDVAVLRDDKARALTDVDFFRGQYQRASDFASSTRSENEELLARAALAESQATNGVALIRATFEARVSKLEAEVRKYKALSEMLTERARRTDDDVRYRAARMPELEREFRQLSQQYTEVEAELEETQDELRAKKRANVRLRRQLASLEMKEQSDAANSRKREPVPWGDDEDDEDYRPDTGSSGSPRGGNDGSSPQHQASHSFPHEDGAQPTGEVEVEQSDFLGLGASVQSINDDMVYLCRWRPSDPEGYCDAVVASKQELHEHVASHHLSCH